MKPFRTALTIALLAAAICIADFVAAAAPGLSHNRVLAGAPQLVITGPSTYQLNLCLVYGADSPTPTPICTPTIEPSSNFEQRVIELTNRERTSKGIVPLQESQALMDAAREHSEDMARNDFMSHTGSDGSSPGERISRAGYDWWVYGENVAAGYPSPADVVDGWMDSEGHRANILNPDLREIGVGYAYGEDTTYGHYWTQDIATR